MSYVIVAKYEVNPGSESELVAHLEAMLPATRNEPGCVSYDVIRSREDGGTFVLVEVYEDEEAFRRHCDADHFREHIVEGAWPLLASREVVRGQPLTTAA